MNWEKPYHLILNLWMNYEKLYANLSSTAENTHLKHNERDIPLPSINELRKLCFLLGKMEF